MKEILVKGRKTGMGSTYGVMDQNILAIGCRTALMEKENTAGLTGKYITETGKTI